VSYLSKYLDSVALSSIQAEFRGFADRQAAGPPSWMSSKNGKVEAIEEDDEDEIKSIVNLAISRP
jgi:hypothetical protein